MSALVAPAAAAATRLLIVEDDERYARLLAQLLANTTPNLEIAHASRIDEACHLVNAGHVDLVVLDLGLPDADGLQALSALQDCVNEIPVVVLTSRADEQLALEALKRGAEDYLVKDAVDRHGLVRAVRYAMERHRGVRDLTRVKKELQLANAALEKLTLLDPLTELLNRRGLQQALTREIQRIERENTKTLVMLIDVDDFKRINDTMGHAVGDIALKEIAHRLRACVRGVDYVCRVGGDEFLLLLPNSNPLEVVRIAERARVSIATMIIQHTQGTLRLTPS